MSQEIRMDNPYSGDPRYGRNAIITKIDAGVGGGRSGVRVGLARP